MDHYIPTGCPDRLPAKQPLHCPCGWLPDQFSDRYPAFPQSPKSYKLPTVQSYLLVLLRVQPVPERKNPSLKSVAAMLPVLLLKVCHNSGASGFVHTVPVDRKPLDIASSYNPFLLYLIFHILTIFTISVKFVVALV